MKRQYEEDAGQALGGIKELWEMVILPFLCAGPLKLWMNLCLVSKEWLQMICHGMKRVDLHGCDYWFLRRGSKFRVFVKRFGPWVEELVVHITMLDYLKDQDFPSLKKLHLLTDSDHSKSNVHHIGKMVGLTSLVVDGPARISGIENLVNLEHLSMLYISSSSITGMEESMNSLKKIKSLCLGSIGSRVRVLLEGLIPPESTLEYLESNDLLLFQDISYTGLGRYTSVFPAIYYHYHGQWLNGKCHGQGEWLLKGDKYKGEWVNGLIMSGTVSYKNGTSYEGEFLHILGQEVYRHGYGIMIGIEGERYEGTFFHNVQQGQGKLYRNDLLVYDGHWEDGDSFQLPSDIV